MESRVFAIWFMSYLVVSLLGISSIWLKLLCCDFFQLWDNLCFWQVQPQLQVKLSLKAEVALNRRRPQFFWKWKTSWVFVKMQWWQDSSLKLCLVGHVRQNCAGQSVTQYWVRSIRWWESSYLAHWHLITQNKLIYI